jgi:hypothetical protein
MAKVYPVIAKTAGKLAAALAPPPAIINGDLEHVSTDLLIRILASLGYSLRISVVKSVTVA